MKTRGWAHEKHRRWCCSLCWTRWRSAPFKQRSSILLLRFPAWSNLHFKPQCPFNQPLCMPSQPLHTLRAKSRTEAHKAIFDYTIAHGETLSNSTASCGEGPGDSQALNLKATFFPERCKESCLWSKQRQLGMPFQIAAPPIVPPLPSTNQGLVSSNQP